MTYSLEQIARSLKSARKHQGLSQQELSAKSGVSQSHISKIEKGEVDLRVSSLIKLAHVLDLGLILVPRKKVPAVQAIGRIDIAEAVSEGAQRSAKELTKLNESVTRLLKENPTTIELARLQRLTRELRHFSIEEKHLAVVRAATDSLTSLQNTSVGMKVLRESLFQLQGLRNSLASAIDEMRTAASVRPAYTLEDDDRG